MNNELIGLSEKEVRESYEKYGKNQLSRKKKRSFIGAFLASFGDPMIKILLIALCINVIFLWSKSDWFETIGIAAAILLATFVSTLSEYGSEGAFEKLLLESSRILCKVKRKKGLMEILSEKIAVGDIVLLEAGDKIPADGILLKGNLSVDQSSINGESKEASIKVQGKLFSGTVVCAGEGYMRVTAVGDNTVLGKIGQEVQTESPVSPLKQRLAKLADGIGKFSYIAAFLTAALYLFNVIVLDRNFNTQAILETLSSPGEMSSYIIKAVTLAVSVIVMAVPEGLPMMITVVLSANMKRMLKDNVLVRKLTGIETAGSLNILFTDKTGTLTKGKLEAENFVLGNGKEYLKSKIINEISPLSSLIADSLYYNNGARIAEGSGKFAANSKKDIIGGNSTDRALMQFSLLFKNRSKNLKKRTVKSFSSDIKYMSTEVFGERNLTFYKGAPEKLLPLCTSHYDEKGNIKSGYNKSEILNIIQKMSENASRIIAICTSNGEFNNLTLVGLVGLRDTLRKEAIKGVAMTKSAGIQTVMITGDSKVTAASIARECGILSSKTDIILTHDELIGMSDSKLSEILPNLRVVARALPDDKSRLVRIAQNNGLVTGMTGDGVNDAPALKMSDIGFAMGSGTEIAKEAAGIVILDDNFNSITKAIMYGRTVFKSIRKFIIYQMSICMCAVGVTVLGPLLGVDFPITVIQMLWINIVMDTLAGLAFSGEKARAGYMKEKPKPKDEPIINSYMKTQIAFDSIFSAGACLFFLKSKFISDIFSEYSELYKMTAFFALFMFLAIFTSLCARTHKINLTEYLAGNKAFIFIMGFVTVCQIAMLYFGGSVFRVSGLEIHHLIFIILLSSLIIPADAIRKILVRHSV